MTIRSSNGISRVGRHPMGGICLVKVSTFGDTDEGRIDPIEMESHPVFQIKS